MKQALNFLLIPRKIQELPDGRQKIEAFDKVNFVEYGYF
ncbi:hypothetical protein DFQ04_0308 [Algoriphagus boseongensis]|uniref:Uncharacterized protein n=1 Tax=Algoriphagus boseongensis TaxID=1442587 RepID=A0A4R6T784_9BACT|nr:hypothetical protein DFQ04_0308 [Algoriphagus boseongensis]